MIGSKIIRDEIVDFYNHKDWYVLDEYGHIKQYTSAAPKHRVERIKKIRDVLYEAQGNSLYTAEEADEMIKELERYIKKDRKKYGN